MNYVYMLRQGGFLPSRFSMHHIEAPIAVLFTAALHAELIRQAVFAHCTVMGNHRQLLELMSKHFWISIFNYRWVGVTISVARNAQNNLWVTVKTSANCKILSTVCAQEPSFWFFPY